MHYSWNLLESTQSVCSTFPGPSVENLLAHSLQEVEPVLG